jgi:5-methyltetrahydrofolate--homocysteine methyltransferase
LHGKFPAILTDEIVGEQATNLFLDAKKMLEEIISKNVLEIRAVLGIFKAYSDTNDDIILPEQNAVFRTLRQQTSKAGSQPNIALSDFIAPQGIEDYVGCFAVSAGFGLDDYIKPFEKNHDDYSSILAKALADRLAEAAAEYVHYLVRTDYWSYQKEEALTNEQMINEEYQGIRPAPGYPACPDHLEKMTIWNLLEVEKNTGMTLTESLAMNPAASVSGYYFAHPESKYFGIGKITDEQVADFAARKGIQLEEAQRWLAPNIL